MPETRKNPDRPIVGVGAVVFKTDQILMIRRSKEPKKGQWSLPGGAQHLGETVKEAISREVLEETGITIQIAELIDVVDFIEWDEGRSKPAYQYTLIDYAAEYVSGELQANSDASEARYFNIEDILALPLWDETKRVIKQAAKQRGLI